MISIIIPAYNCENTISQTLESCLNLTYIDLEIIVINDASSDNTQQVIESFTDPRIKCIINKNNLGPGLSRRLALNIMKGEYMTFLDADDYIKEDYIETLYNFSQLYNAFIVSSGIISTDFYGNVLSERKPKEVEFQTYNRHTRNPEDTKRFMNCMLIRSSLWDNVEYSPRRMHEDVPTLFKIIYFSPNLLLINYAGYYYRQNPNSIIHTLSKDKLLVYSTLAIKDIQTFLYEYGRDWYRPEDFIRTAKLLLNSNIQGFEEELEEIQDYLKQLEQ